jgi:hypothetical protein
MCMQSLTDTLVYLPILYEKLSDGEWQIAVQINRKNLHNILILLQQTHLGITVNTLLLVGFFAASDWIVIRMLSMVFEKRKHSDARKVCKIKLQKFGTCWLFLLL